MEWIKKQSQAYYLLTNLPIKVSDTQETVLIEHGTMNISFHSIEFFSKKGNEMKSCLDTYTHTSGEHFACLYINNHHGKFYVLAGPFTLKAQPHHLNYLKQLFDMNKIPNKNQVNNPFNHTFFDKIKIEYREIDFYHHNYFVEKMFFHHVFNNRLSESDTQKFISQEPGLMAEDPTNNIIHLATVVLTLAGRYSIEFGLDTHTAFTISDSYFRRIDRSKTMKEIHILLQQALDEYTDALSIISKNKYSKKINDAKSFIDHNLSIKFTLKDIADHVKLNSAYLSRQFKKEVGINISNYVLNEKIKEAKIMLDYSIYSLQEISDILHFSSKSYFIRCFKKIEGLTPLDYKNKGH